MMYTHVARKGPAGVPSPLDLLDVSTDEVHAAVAATHALAAGLASPPLCGDSNPSSVFATTTAAPCTPTPLP